MVLIATGVTVLASQTPPIPAVGAGDTVSISLDEALARALNQSEEIGLARSRLRQAEAQVTSVRAAALPQVNANLGYTKTLASAFDTGGGFTIPDSLRFAPDPNAPLEERVRYLEDRVPSAGLAGLGEFFGNLPFGQENAYSVQLSGEQLLYSGGRVGAALDIARSYRAAAGLGLVEETAELALQVRRAYYQALFSAELETISAAALEQADSFLRLERLRFQAGQASELDVLRAEVAMENLRPQVIQARNASELASLNLKRLIDIPLQQPIRFTTRLEAPSPAEGEALVDPALLTAGRAGLQAARQQVEIREQQLRIAKGAFLPNVTLRMNYGRQLFPSAIFDFAGSWRTDWTATLGVQLPIFNGFRRLAEISLAQQDLVQSRLELSQLQEAVQLQYEQARGERERARSAISARDRTVAMADRVHRLTELRYRQGLATQIEVSDARLALLQARTNLAQALSDFYIADAELARSLVESDSIEPNLTGRG